MAKIIVTNDAVINGVNRLFKDDKIAFSKEITGFDSFIVTTSNNKGDKSFASGVIALKLDTMTPIIIEYRSLWGVASTPKNCGDIITRTPQCLHNAGNSIFRNGSDAIANNSVYSVGNVYDCEFNRRDKTKGKFSWDIIGLDNTDDQIVINGDEVIYGEIKAKIADIKVQIDELVKKQNSRVSEYDW